MYDIIIIGAGPAGLTAALYARRRNSKVLILEEKSYGGQIINTPRIENYPAIAEISGFDFATNLYHQVKDLNPDFKYEKVIKIEENKVITIKNEYETKSIIIATGVQNKKLGLEKEEEFIGRGQIPNNNMFEDIIQLNKEGYILSEDGVHTSHKGIYVAGDTREKELRQLTTAVADGALAATKALQELDF